MKRYLIVQAVILIAILIPALTYLMYGIASLLKLYKELNEEESEEELWQEAEV